jgi:hypothetical protein
VRLGGKSVSFSVLGHGVGTGGISGIRFCIIVIARDVRYFSRHRKTIIYLLEEHRKHPYGASGTDNRFWVVEATMRETFCQW